MNSQLSFPVYVVTLRFVYQSVARHVTVCATTSEAAAKSLGHLIQSSQKVWACKFLHPWGARSTFVELPDELMVYYFNSRPPHCDLAGDRVEPETTFLLRSADVVVKRV